MRAAALLAAVLLFTAEDPLPEGNAYVRGLLDRQRRREELVDRYTYDRLAVREELDERGRIKERHVRRYEVYFVKGRPVRRLVEEDGRPLRPDRQAREDRKARELAESVRGGRSVSERPGMRLSAILARYDFRAKGRETIAGRPAIVLEFRPRPGARDLDRDRLLRRVQGRIWVDEAEQEVVRAEMSNLAPLRFGWGLGASIASLATRIEFRKVDDAVWLPAEDETLASGRMLLFKKFRTRIRHTYTGYRQFTIESEETAAPRVLTPSPDPSPP
jgi:hypothetical protein